MNATKRLVPAIVALVVVNFLPRGAVGQYADEIQLAKVSAVRVATIFDFASDGENCTPSASILKAEAELVLRRSGISVVDEGYSHSFGIFLVGLYANSGCALAYEYELSGSELLQDRTRGIVMSFSSMGVMTGGTRTLQRDVRDLTNEKATVLANEILKARMN